jgi:hypothetical protein
MSPKAPPKSQKRALSEDNEEEDEVLIKKPKVTKKPVKVTAAPAKAVKAKIVAKEATDNSSDEEDDEEDEEVATLKKGAKKKPVKKASVKKATKCANPASSNDDENPSKRLKTKEEGSIKKEAVMVTYKIDETMPDLFASHNGKAASLLLIDLFELNPDVTKNDVII